MSAKDSVSNKAAIEQAAFRLFKENGYKLTSYSLIAEECGLGRPLVQYYFPKKEDLAADFILRVLEEISNVMGMAPSGARQAQTYLMQFGQTYYAFLLKDESMRRLTYDLLTSRQVTSRVIETNAIYSVPILERDTPEAERNIEASIAAVGGVYELMFRWLEQGKQLDPATLSAQNIAAFLAFVYECDFKAKVKALLKQALDEKRLKAVCACIEKRIFT